MKNEYENKPLYRLFNVILFILYTFIVLFTALTIYIAYTSREVTDATVQCNDGTKWNAFKPKKIIYDYAALCGICTNRDEDGTYTYCKYDDIGYYSSHEIINKKYAWSWWVILAPLLAFTIGFGLVDFLRLIIIYILSGRIAIEKSILLRIIALLASNSNSQQDSTPTINTQVIDDTLESKYPLLLKIVEKKKLIDAMVLQNNLEIALKQAQQELDDFLKKTGYDVTYLESNESLTLETSVLEEYYKLDNDYKDLQLTQFILNRYFDSLDKINNKLNEGEGIVKAKEYLNRLQKQNDKEVAELKVQREIAKEMGIEIIETKKKYGRDIKDKKIDMNNIIKRIEAKHPDWKNEKNKN